MYTNPYLVLNEKGRPRGCPFLFLFVSWQSGISSLLMPKKKLSSFHSLFNLYFDQYEVMPHFIILGKQPI